MKYEVAYQELLLALTNSTLKYKIDKVLTDIYNDENLIELIKKYHINYDNNIRLSIYNNEKYKEYKKLENELNFLILELNKIFLELKEDL